MLGVGCCYNKPDNVVLRLFQLVCGRNLGVFACVGHKRHRLHKQNLVAILIVAYKAKILTETQTKEEKEDYQELGLEKFM